LTPGAVGGTLRVVSTVPPPRILVLADAALADELLAIVESRAGVAASFDSEEELIAEARHAVTVVVVPRARGKDAAVRIARRLGPEGPRVVLLCGDDESGMSAGEVITVPRREAFAVVGALCRFDHTIRLPVQILARYELGDDGDKRLGNVLELGISSLLFDADHTLPDEGAINVSFVVPGTTSRVRLYGSLGGHDPINSSRVVLLDSIEAPTRAALRGFLEKRLVRTPAEVL
jgi:hypothetical protein